MPAPAVTMVQPLSSPAPAAPKAAAAAPGPAAAASTPPAGVDPNAPKHVQAWQYWQQLDQRKKSKASFFAAGMCAVLFVVILVLHIATSTSSATTPRQQVVVFTDGRPDDFLALNYLAHRSDVSVSMVVVAAGSVGSAAAAVRNVRGFYGLVAKSAGGPSAPRIFVGSPFPLADRSRHNCTYVRAVDPAVSALVDDVFGASAALRRSAPARSAADLFAAANAATKATGGVPTVVDAPPAYFLPALRSQLSGAVAGSVVLLALGPLTDVAAVLDDANGNLRTAIGRVVVSGGAVQRDGDLGPFFGSNTRAETNFFLDPDAAHRVLARQPGDPAVTVVPVDVAVSVPYAAAWAALVTNVPSGRPVDAWLASMLAAFYSATKPQSRFADVGVPRDLIAAVAASSPRFRGQSRAFVASVGVAAHPGALDVAGVLGATTNSTNQPVAVLSAIPTSTFWSEYQLMTAAPWPQ